MSTLGSDLVRWYRGSRVLYPWRTTTDPYAVWLSEILLQQTRIPVVLSYYEKILRQFPSFKALASAKPERFVAAWSGIGYYRRAYHMLDCAKQVVLRHEGAFPRDYDELLRLPGIGPYTAGAIRNLCFEELTPAIDGNVSRVLARLTGNAESMSSASFRAAIREAFLQFGRCAQPSDYFQALMEIGERICLPQPDCRVCPVQVHCAAFRNGQTRQIPARKKEAKIKRVYWYFLVIRKGSAFYFAKNQTRDFLKDSWIFPDVVSERELTPLEIRSAFLQSYGIPASFQEVAGIRHAVTFRRIQGKILIAKKFRIQNGSGKWLTTQSLTKLPTSSVVNKIWKAINAGAFSPDTLRRVRSGNTRKRT